MQINRLFEMVYLLLSRESRTMTAKELAEHFEISTRTVYRDIEILCQAGIPIYTNKGKGGGISLMEDFILNKSVLSEEEKNDILWSLQGLSGVKALNGENTLSKLKSLFGARDHDWIEIDFSDWGEYRADIFAKIKEAVIGNQVIEFEYYNSNGEKSKRQAEPFRLWFKSKSWYLKAYCRKSKAMRVFKIRRMRNIKVIEEGFLYQNEKEIKEKEASGSQAPRVEILLHISSGLGFRVFDEFSEEAIDQQPDGSFLVTFCGVENEWVYNLILSYGSDIKVVKPQRIQQLIKDRLVLALKNYEEG